MTIEEAYELITNIVQGDGTNMTKEKDEALYYAQKAMEKQMSKKPQYNEHSYNVYKCEICGATVGAWNVEHTEVIKTLYCQKCGQAVDWSNLK